MFRLILNWDVWKTESQEGRLCGILGCQEKPSIRCPICGNHYSEDHSKVHGHVTGEKIREAEK